MIVGSPGGKIEEWGSRPADMDYPEGWSQLISFLMAGLGITKPAAGMIEDASYASLFATLKQLHLLTLKPMLDRFASKLTRHLASFWGDDLIIEIRCPRIDDHDVRNGKLTLAIQARCITKNEIRKELELPLTKEEWGEEIAGTETLSEAQQEQQEEIKTAGKENSNAFGGQGGGQPGKQAKPPSEEPPELKSPSTGSLGKDSLGPRDAKGLVKDVKRLKKDVRGLQAVSGNGRH